MNKFSGYLGFLPAGLYDPWDYMDLTEAKEQLYVACDLITLFDLAEGRVLLLKPTSANTEGMKTYEI